MTGNKLALVFDKVSAEVNTDLILDDLSIR